MEFSHYDYVPNEIAEKVISAARAAEEWWWKRKKFDGSDRG